MFSPRVVGAAVQGVVGVGAERKLRGVRAPDDDGTRVFQVAHNAGIVRRDQILEGGYAICCGVTGLIHIDLDGDWHPMQRPFRSIGCVQVLCLCAGFIGKAFDNRVQVWVRRLHARDGGLGRLRCADLTGRCGRSNLCCAPLPKGGVCHSSLSCLSGERNHTVTRRKRSDASIQRKQLLTFAHAAQPVLPDRDKCRAFLQCRLGHN